MMDRDGRNPVRLTTHEDVTHIQPGRLMGKRLLSSQPAIRLAKGIELMFLCCQLIGMKLHA